MSFYPMLSLAHAPIHTYGQRERERKREKENQYFIEFCVVWITACSNLIMIVYCIYIFGQWQWFAACMAIRSFVYNTYLMQLLTLHTSANHIYSFQIKSIIKLEMKVSVSFRLSSALVVDIIMIVYIPGRI